MITIYFDHKPLFLVTDREEVKDYLQRDDTMFIDDFDSHTIRTMIYEMAEPNIQAGVFLSDNVEALLEAFKKKFTVIQAAGGFVYTSTRKALFIFRRGKWDLPKGKLDDNESLKDCALREVKEETGIKKIKIEQPIIITYHTYHQQKEFILKESHWYLMKAKEEEETKPQTTEDIEKCDWVPFSEIDQYVGSSYNLIRKVAESAIRAIG